MKKRKLQRILVPVLCLLVVFCSQSVFADQSEQAEPGATQVSQTAVAESGEEEGAAQESAGTKDSKPQAEKEDKAEPSSAESTQEKEDTKATQQTDEVKGTDQEGQEKTAPDPQVPEAPAGPAESFPLKVPPLKAVHNDVITEMQALLQDGSGPATNISQWQVFQMKAKFALPNGEVKAGDTTVITLPDELRFYTTTAFDIKDQDGHVVAKAVIDGSAKTITMTYTDYPETHSDVKGDFHFYVRIDRTVVTEETDIPLAFDVSGETVIGGSVHYLGPDSPTPKYLSKSGDQTNTDDPRHLSYRVSVNTIKKDIRNAVVNDRIQTEGITYDADSFVIKKGKWQEVSGDMWLLNEQDVTDQYAIVLSEDRTSFSVDFGDISAEEGFQIRYTATADYDFADGERIKNEAHLTGSNIETAETYGDITYHIAGGSAEGYVCSIRISKQNKNGEPLSGAVFQIVRTANGAVAGEITTDANGEGTLTGLLKDQYTIIEVSAPTGYIPLEEPVVVDVSDYSEENIAVKTITNTLETIDIPVKKAWVGAPLDKVTVRLFADGQEVDTADLKSEINWEHTFRDLIRIDREDGHEIAYEVKEDAVSGYASGRSGTAENGYTFTNTIEGKASIPVTKVWDGQKADSATIHLLADGAPAGIIVLSEDNQWQYTFEDLPAYAEGGEKISYTITEDEISGYDTTISGDAVNGFTVTNKEKEVTEMRKDTSSKDTDSGKRHSTGRSDSPGTGDTNNTAGAALFLLFSAAAIAWMVYRHKRRKQEEI